VNTVEKETAVAMEPSEHANGTNGRTDLDSLFLVGGVALMVFGAGLIVSNPVVRRYLGQIGLGNLATAALPDLQRYMRLRDM
jgi:hypothetical protein